MEAISGGTSLWSQNRVRTDTWVVRIGLVALVAGSSSHGEEGQGDTSRRRVSEGVLAEGEAVSTCCRDVEGLGVWGVGWWEDGGEEVVMVCRENLENGSRDPPGQELAGQIALITT